MNSLISVRLGAMMFLQFFIWGAWYVDPPGFLNTINFKGNDIGWMYAVGPIAGMISPLFVGLFVDRFFATQRTLGVMHLLAAAAMYAATTQMVGVETKPWLVNLAFFAHMLCYYPTLSLTNTLALHNITDAEKQFPLIRVFGTVGWIVAGQLVVWLTWSNSINTFYLTAGAGVLMGLYCFTLPHTPAPLAGKKMTIREALGLDALVLLKRPSFLAFMTCSFLICIPLAFYYQLAQRCIWQGGMSEPTAKMTHGQISEIFFMLVMPLCFARLGVKWMLLVGMFAWVARYALFAAGAPDGVFWMLYVGVLLHGICYDFFFVTGQIYTDKVAPASIRGQAQGMLVLFTLGLGLFIGAKVGGWVEEHYTPPITGHLWAIAGAVGEQTTQRKSALGEFESNNPDATQRADALADEFDSLSDDNSQPADSVADLGESETASIDAQIETLEEQLAQADGESKETIDKQLGEVRKQKAQAVARVAEANARRRVEQAVADEPEMVQRILVGRLTVDTLTEYRAAAQLRGLRAMDWRSIWMIPAIGAAVVMVIFLLVFRDDTSAKKVPV